MDHETDKVVESSAEAARQMIAAIAAGTADLDDEIYKALDMAAELMRHQGVSAAQAIGTFAAAAGATWEDLHDCFFCDATVMSEVMVGLRTPDANPAVRLQSGPGAMVRIAVAEAFASGWCAEMGGTSPVTLRSQILTAHREGRKAAAKAKAFSGAVKH